MSTTQRRSGAEAALVRQLGRPAVVMVSPADGGWVAEVAALGIVRKAHRLRAVDLLVRELFGTAAVDYQFRTGDAELDRLVMQIRSAGLAMLHPQERARCLAGIASRLPSRGTAHDLALLLGLTCQQVHEVLRQHPRVSTARTDACD